MLRFMNNNIRCNINKRITAIGTMEEIHINKLPSSKHFAVTQIKQLLPIHQPTAIQNLRIIFTNYALSNYPRNIILVPDECLSLSQSNTVTMYTNLKAVWFQDYDSQSDHLKTSLSVGCSLLNYIGSIDEDSPVQQPHHDNQDYIKRTDIITILNGEKSSKKNKKYENIKQTKTFIGFKFEKIDNKIYMLMGLNIKTREGVPLECAILRLWNMRRFNVNQLSLTDFDMSHRICQHLFCLGRGFMRQVNDDYNTYRINVLNLISKYQNWESNVQERLCQLFKQSKLNTSNLDQQGVVLKYHITFRNAKHKQQYIWEIMSEIVVEWLLQTPLNASISYASHLNYDQISHSMTIIVASHYQMPADIKFPQDSSLPTINSKIQSLLFDRVYSKPQPQANSLKASMMLMDKYQKTDKNDPTTQRILLIQPQSSSNNSQNNSMNDSFISLLSNQSQSRKMNMKDIAKLQNQIYEILKLINSKKPIIGPIQLEQQIREYVRKLQRQEVNDGVSDQQYDALLTLDAINQVVTANQMYMLIKNNLNQANLIVNYFMQKSKYNRAVLVGRMIATDHLEKLYKGSLRDGLIAGKDTIIPYYLKKIVQAYVQPAISPKPLQVQQISIPQLVEIIEKKNYNSHTYTSILTVLFPQLFPLYQLVIKVLSPLLSFYIEYLQKLDHHQQLILSFIGDLLYQVCYFTTETKLNSLTNAVYMEDKYSKTLTLKQKKILQMVREGGFKGFGFEVKNQLLPLIETHKNYAEPQEILFHVIRVKKPTQLQLFYKFMSSCHYTITINKIAKYLQFKNHYASTLTKNIPLVCYILLENKILNAQQRFQGVKMVGQKTQDGQFNSIAQRILRSESGFFQDIVKLNPKVKIAGIQLKTAMKTLTDSRAGTKNQNVAQNKKGRLDQQQTIQTYLSSDIKHNYEYVSLAWSLKEKYLRYPTLTQNQKTYFRDCASAVVEHKSQITNYVALSQKIKSLKPKK